MTTNFNELGLSKAILDAISEMGFEQPTEIQALAIPRLLSDQTDFVGLAQTGTGKTAAFGLPLLDLVDDANSNTQALILAPTRELCVQITKELLSFAKYKKSIKVKSVYGGVDIQKQIKDIKRGAHIIAATPGRLRDLIRRRAVDIRQIDYIVLDEADEMLNMGFKEEIDDILENTPEEKMTWLFSATMPNEVRRISLEYMADPLEMSVGERNKGNADIDHQVVITRPSERLEALKRYLDYNASIFGLVFCRTRRDTMDVADALVQEGYNADALHGDLSQAQRDRVMARFRSRQLRVLVATDVAARGIDVNEITHVFHFNIPDDKSFYTHRSGRTGRAGNKGVSVVFCHPKDRDILRRMERQLKLKFTLGHIPTGEEICKEQLLTSFKRISETKVDENINEFFEEILQEVDDLSKTELIRRLATLSFSGIYKRYKNAPDLNHAKAKKKRQKTENMHRLFINVGRMDVADKGKLIALICETADIKGSIIGRIDMQRMRSTFDVEQEYAQRIKSAFRGATLEGRALRVNDEGRRKRADRDSNFKKKKKGGKKRARR